MLAQLAGVLAVLVTGLLGAGGGYAATPAHIAPTQQIAQSGIEVDGDSVKIDLAGVYLIVDGDSVEISAGGVGVVASSRGVSITAPGGFTIEVTDEGVSIGMQQLETGDPISAATLGA